jgi:hypothetical protein
MFGVVALSVEPSAAASVDSLVAVGDAGCAGHDGREDSRGRTNQDLSDHSVELRELMDGLAGTLMNVSTEPGKISETT